MKIVGMIRSTATQEVEPTARITLPPASSYSSPSPKVSSHFTFAGALRRTPFHAVSTQMLTPPADCSSVGAFVRPNIPAAPQNHPLTPFTPLM